MPPETDREKTPPPKSNPPPPPVNSTPFKLGTAADSRAGVISTDRHALIKPLEQDLQNTPIVEFVPMLKALLALQFQREIEPNRKVSRQTEENGAHQDTDTPQDWSERHFTAMLESAIKFCNDPTRSATLKENLRKAFRTKSETGRYHPLVLGLNSILSNFQATRIGELEASNDFVFMVNDPIIIKSADVSASGVDDSSLELSMDAPQCTERKPDIIDPRIAHLRKLMPESQDFELDDWINVVGHKVKELREARDKASPADKTSWDDISHCWELKSFRILRDLHIAFLDQAGGFTVENALDPDKTALLEAKSDRKAAQQKRHADLMSESTSTSGQKRPREDDHEKKGKKKHKSGSSSGSKGRSKSNGSKGRSGNSGAGGSNTPSGNSESNVPGGGNGNVPYASTPNLTPTLQCGFYGVELLRSRWDRTHAIVMLLEDERLSLRWHDAQGCIGTASIDILAQLPLLVVMILLFQRFGKQMRGNAGWTLQGKVDGKDLEYALPDHARSGWELKGRRLVVATPLVPGDPADPAPASTYRTRGAVGKKEPTLKRSENLFFKLSWREETRDDEAHIVETAKERAKHYLKERAGDVINHLPDIKHSKSDPLFSTGSIRELLDINKDGARVPAFMLAQKLHGLDTVQPTDIVPRMWEIIRCHYLLWQIGIAHGDISYWNLMVRNTDNGAYGVVNDFDLAAIMTPGQQSPTRQGFERTGTKPFMAVLLLLATPKDPVQRRGVDEWREGSFKQVCGEKNNWISALDPNKLPENCRQGSELIWRPLTRLFHRWMERQRDVFRFRDEEYSDKGNMLLIDRVLPYPKRPSGEEWDWMDWAVKEEDIREEDQLLVKNE
ncbi:hypothetical protein EST38_g10061 [Candolleomyces aberdarensis]|uniref:Fungal-type protein kinase domain-containing protein n=1 Tax=Candolleomyces aberdarensis TaxID=2316362 RepID=A0A4Q2D8C8_9AGAR|nr:hypothetical protein EST38_g10061 [Candolleomyces aberdarensis]